MIEFTLIEGVVDGAPGFGPHFVEVWCSPSTSRRQGQVFVTLFTSVASWVGEYMRVEEFAKDVGSKLAALNNTGNWAVELAYNVDKHRWTAKAKHTTEEGLEGLSKAYMEEV